MPTYNHADQLIGVLDRAAKIMIPIVVVEDGSTDGTRSRLEAWSEIPRPVETRLEFHDVNLGKAAALRTAFESAARMGCTHAVTLDADGQLAPEEIPLLLDASREHPAALVLGVRSETIENCPAKSLIGRRVSNMFILLESGVRVRDSQCGLRVYPLEFVKRVKCSAGRYGFETEIITRAGWAGLRVVEVPVSCRYPPGNERVSHFMPWKDTLRAVVMHARLVGRAMLPLPFEKVHQVDENKQVAVPAWRRLIRWLNPLRSWREVREQSLSRMELATGLSLGVFIGATPLYGFHTLLCIYAAWRLHLKPVPVVLGSQISTPPLGIALAVASVAIGRFLRTGGWPEAASFEHPIHEFWKHAGIMLLDWGIGSLIVGGALAAMTFAIVSLFFRFLSTRAKG